MPSSRDQPFSVRFLYLCKQYPSRQAIVDQEGIYTYELLLNRVYAQMEFIQQEMPDELAIGVVDQNDVNTYASFLAINLLGKTWVPLSPKNPESRNRFILQTSGCRSIFSSKPFALDVFRIYLTNPSSLYRERIVPVASSAHPAYILFTSGTTGTPKGVPVGNKQLNAFFDFFLESGPYQFQPSDRFLQVYEAGFDVSVFVAFSALLSGACMYMLPRKQFLFQEIPLYLEKYAITVLSLVPSVLHYWSKYFKDMRFEKLRYSFFSGDKLLHSLAEQWSRCIPQAELINCYGPTETTIVCSHYRWNKELSDKESLNGVVPIGRLFPGMESIIRKEIGEETPAGELWLAGDQVIDGYLNQASANHFMKQMGKQFFRTGDRVVMLASGAMQFAGRTDFQVKINGYRVEPGETEAVLSRLCNEALCAVISIEEENGLNRLYAFVAGKGKEEVLIRSLQDLLPLQAVPSRIIFLDEMPLNRNGKTDRAELRKFVG
ncbi:MAG TPA: AMP-binding protein [Bacteroidia bacterium]|jgi:D-alanine--poly(phosphoribitol) ligase subunit 1|nr:AMP-binding protein [Bacteroidia bacterium]